MTARQGNMCVSIVTVINIANTIVRSWTSPVSTQSSRRYNAIKAGKGRGMQFEFCEFESSYCKTLCLSFSSQVGYYT